MIIGKNVNLAWVIWRWEADHSEEKWGALGRNNKGFAVGQGV